MSLDKDARAKALSAFHAHDGGFSASFNVAIETYLEEMFKPGQLVMGEAIQPARDYRKELWIGVATAVAGCSTTTEIKAPPTWADRTLAEFDKTFPKDPS